MCLSSPKMPAPQKIAAYDNTEAVRQSDIEARLRKRRAGAAANVLTGAMGIPSGAVNGQMGGAAQ